MHLKSMENAFMLTGKNAIVTGGGRGIGLGISTALAHQGANVAIFARGEAAAKEAIADLSSKYDGKFTYYPTDISDLNSVRASVEKYIEDNGHID
ncbi:MAG: SDR family NAD(P)-dependent oxidoreductase, partial [Oscillospiraceae bacterium]|nr:SDR family NAD(P)-dependent oxidoreductase [Oscillospiraceae bacterium]